MEEGEHISVPAFIFSPRTLLPTIFQSSYIFNGVSVSRLLKSILWPLSATWYVFSNPQMLPTLFCDPYRVCLIFFSAKISLVRIPWYPFGPIFITLTIFIGIWLCISSQFFQSTFYLCVLCIPDCFSRTGSTLLYPDRIGTVEWVQDILMERKAYIGERWKKTSKDKEGSWNDFHTRNGWGTWAIYPGEDKDGWQYKVSCFCLQIVEDLPCERGTELFPN